MYTSWNIIWYSLIVIWDIVLLLIEIFKSDGLHYMLSLYVDQNGSADWWNDEMTCRHDRQDTSNCQTAVAFTDTFFSVGQTLKQQH